jgi:LPS-assembly protein
MVNMRYFFLLLLTTTSLYASDTIQLQADYLDYDHKLQEVTASNNVIVTEKNNMLHARKVSYFVSRETIAAYDDIVLYSDKNIIFADNAEVKQDFSSGTFNNFSTRLYDRSILTARSAEILDPEHYQLTKVSYTTCPVCKGHQPQWQIKAKEVLYSKDLHMIRYKNAFFELYGIPILYTPYFEHPTNEASRKSGFLRPQLGKISQVGNTLTVPYYWNIALNRDATINATITSNAGIVMSGEYRHLIKAGQYRLFGSATRYKDQNLSHLEGKGTFAIKPGINSGFDFKIASNKIYLKKYKFGDEDYLTSKLFVNHINHHNYSSLQTLYFQGLKESDRQRKIPFILPLMNSHYETKPVYHNMNMFMDSNVMILSRDEGSNTKRISITGGTKWPIIMQQGHVLEWHNRIRTDLYEIDDNTKYGVQRLVPETELNWRYPLSGKNIIIEPIAELILTPRQNYGNDKIPNEDSNSFEISDENLFRPTRFSGLDRVDDSSRINYGLDFYLHNAYFKDIHTIFGQSYYLVKDNIWSKLNYNRGAHFSDYVGRFKFTPSESFNLSYKYKLSRDNLAALQHEVMNHMTYKSLSFDIGYISLNAKAPSQNSLSGDQLIKQKGYTPMNKQLLLASSIKLLGDWHLNAATRYNLSHKVPFEKHKKLLSVQGNIIYSGDCLEVRYSVTRDFTKDPIYKGKSDVTHSINFYPKNLGID